MYANQLNHLMYVSFQFSYFSIYFIFFIFLFFYRIRTLVRQKIIVFPKLVQYRLKCCIYIYPKIPHFFVGKHLPQKSGKNIYTYKHAHRINLKCMTAEYGQAETLNHICNLLIHCRDVASQQT